jgi:acyl-coenzyme A synthetase/AMP-(fatty) acid ligase
LTALLSLDCDLFLLDDALSPEAIAEFAGSFQFDTILDPVAEDDDLAVRRRDGAMAMSSSRSGRGAVTLFTSGSTGRPKSVCHNWESLTRAVRQTSAQSPLTWLLTYRPHLYAGLQVFVHCLLNRETLVMPGDGMAVDRLLELMCRHRITAVSATPSYWRRIIALGRRDTLRQVSLTQITLGGEAADQSLLSALAGLYPEARVVHIYATSELGRCFSIKDGLAGFPVSFLDQPTDDGVELRVEDGELLVRPANGIPGICPTDGSARNEREWIATADLVERVGDRFLFIGRRSEVINVGGNKVHPFRVEQVILAVPGVRDARVFAKRSSLVGEMVACEFVAQTGFDSDQVTQAIQTICRERLGAAERPRLVRATDTIELSGAAKKIRGGAD